MSEINITTVRDMIDSSFYEEDTNTVNFKMIQNVLYILARQLRILQRHVSLERARRLHMLQGEIKVTEIKVHSKVPKDSSPEARGGKRRGSPENKGTKGLQETQGGPGDKGGRRGPEGQGSKGGPGDQGVKSGPGQKGTKGGQGSKGGQEAQRIPESTEGKGTPDTSGSKTSSKAKGRQGATPQHQGGKEDQGTKGRQGSPDSKKKQGGQTKVDEAGEEGGGKQLPDKSATKALKGKTTKPSATDDATTLKAATGKSQGKSGDRKGGKKGDDDDDMEVLQEKLLVVSRTSSTDGGRGTVATLDQFKDMVSQIRELQAKLGLEDTLDTEALRGALHKETSLSHPIAAVNMSSRLEAAEKKLATIMPIVTELAEKTPGIDMDAAYDDVFLKTLKTVASKTALAGNDDQATATAEGPTLTTLKQESDEESLEMDVPDATFSLLDPSVKGVTHVELNEGLEEIYKAVLKNITEVSKNEYTIADGAMKRTQRMDAKLDQAMKVSDAFAKLDTSVEDYTDKINDLDGRLTTQMTCYQDELMQMQHNLESGLDAITEVLAAPTEDAAAIAELNGYFTNFQFDIERTLERQQELRTLQMEYAASLDELKQKIKELQNKKSTRDEVTDALSDKAGIAALNGLVTMEQYQAVRGDIEKRIGQAYDKFNNKEITWQKAIDDLVRELNEKTDIHQLVYLNKGIQRHLSLMRTYLDDMLALVGDIDPLTTNRKVARDENCLSCGTPFNAVTDEDRSETRPPVIGAETVPGKEDLNKKYKRCYPGYPVTHPIDPRSLICHRYCGATGSIERESAFKMQISELNPNLGIKIETGEQVHSMDKHKKPCMPCNVPGITPVTPPDSIRFNVLVSEPIDTFSNDEPAAHERGIIK